MSWSDLTGAAGHAGAPGSQTATALPAPAYREGSEGVARPEPPLPPPPDPPEPERLPPALASELPTAWSADPDGTSTASEPSRRRRRRGPRWWAVRVSLLVVLLAGDAAILLFFVAGRYQPVVPIASPPTSFPGLAAPLGARTVNNFGGLAGQLYVPPQSTRFPVTTTIRNSGSHSVSILSVQLYAPGTQQQWPLQVVGQVRYRFAGSPASFPTWTLTGTLDLAPGESLLVAVPVRFAYGCFLPGAYGTFDKVWVEERWLFFTRWLQVPVSPILFEDPEPSPGPGAPRGVIRPVCTRSAAAER